MLTDAAELIDVEYLSPDWYAVRREGVTASEIAAVLNIVPGAWSSRFDLWWAKQGGGDSQAESDSMRRGRRYEAMVVAEFADEHPELVVGESVTVRSVERPWQIATPDGLVRESPGGHPVAVIEAKTGQRREWGEPGTDQIPIHYRAQVLWQMDVLGLGVAYVPVKFNLDQYAEYIVEWDAADVAFLRDEAAGFLDSLRAGTPPEIDGSEATARRLQMVHPTITEGEVEINPAVIAQYHAARRLRDAAQQRMRLAENRIRDALGPHNIATVEGRKVASRSVYDVPARTQEVGAHTVNRLNFSKPKAERNQS